MSSSTRQAVATAKDLLKPLLADADLRFAEEIFAIGEALAGSKQLRNILSDPSAENESKRAAISSVFGPSISAKSVDFLGKLVQLRWSKGQDLVEALEELAVHSVAAVAAKSDQLEKLEAEVFEFKKVIDSDQELQIALASRQASFDAKLSLVNKLAAGKFSEGAMLLVRFALSGASKRRLSLVLTQFGRLLSAFAGKLVANVTVAAPITQEQRTQLEKVLARDYGSSLRLNVEVDPLILGGIKVQIAGEIIDGSVENRLKQARMMLANAGI